MRIFVVLMCLILSQFSFGKQKNDYLDNMAVLVTSCDKYEEVWHPFFELLEKNWPELEKNKKYLISNKKTYIHPSVIPVQIPNEKSWSDNMLKALDQIEENYVMVFIEDYFMLPGIDHIKVKEFYDVMRAEEAGYLKLRVGEYEKTHPKDPGLAYLGQRQLNRTALQLAIWNKETLRKLLKRGENPWDFELDGNERSFDLKEPFMGITKDIVPYFGAVEKGYWEQGALDKLKEQGIIINPKLPIAEKTHRVYFKKFRYWVHEYITGPLKRFFGLEKFKILPTHW